MFGITRRRVVAGVTSSVIAGSLVLLGVGPASADEILAPIIPQVASAASGICVAAGVETLGTACALAGVGLVAVGAWWAWQNADTIMQWINPTSPATGVQGFNGTYQFIGWTSSLPPPSAGPFDTTTSSVDNFAAVDLVGDAGGINWQLDAWCVDGVGNLSHQSLGNPGNLQTVGQVLQTVSGKACNVAGLRVVQYVWTCANCANNVKQQLIWTAGGTWAPLRDQVVTVTCKTPGAGTTTITATTTGAASGTADQATIPPCPSGTYISNTTVQEVAHGLPGPGHTVATWGTATGIETTYPNCFTGSSPGYAGCVLHVTYQGTPCTTSMAACSDWQGASALGTPGYGCLWGPYTVPLTSCAPDRYAYAPGTVVDPVTHLPSPPPAPSPSASASGGTFPTTGPNPLPSPSASASGWVQPQPFPTPTGSTTPVPLPPPVVGPTPAGANCMAAAWSWNPVNWVVVPVECALTWAFVPDQAVMQQTKTEMADAWNTSGTGTFVSGAWSMLSPLGSLAAGDAGSCGLTVDFPYATGHVQTIHLLDACTPPMSTYAPWVKGFLTAMVLFDGVYACVRALGIGFGIGVPPKQGQLDLFSQN